MSQVRVAMTDFRDKRREFAFDYSEFIFRDTFAIKNKCESSGLNERNKTNVKLNCSEANLCK